MSSNEEEENHCHTHQTIGGVLSTLIKTSFAFLAAYALRDLIHETIQLAIGKKQRYFYTCLYTFIVITLAVTITLLLVDENSK